MTLHPASLSLILSLSVAAACFGQESAASDLLAAGRAGIEANCADCLDASREGLEQGVAKVLQALELGVEEPAAAYLLLGSAYNVLGVVHAEPDSAEQQKILEQKLEAYERYLELEPEDSEAMYEYAFALGDEAATMATLKRVLELDPEHPGALFAIGQYEVSQGQLTPGLEKMQRVFDHAEGERALHYGRRLRWALQAHGLEAEDQQVARRLREIEAWLKKGPWTDGG